MMQLSLASLLAALWLMGVLVGAPPSRAAVVAVPQSDEMAARIRSLKIEADEALRAGKPERAERIYLQILQLDPDDFLAREQRDKIQAQRTKEESDAAQERVQNADREAKQRALQVKLSAAEDLVLQARTGGAATLLDEAQKNLDDIRRLEPSFPNLVRVQELLDKERRARRDRFYTIVILATAAALAILIPVGLHLWRGRRVLEMVDGPSPGQVFTLHKSATKFGALASECDIAIADPLRKISRRHCEVVRQGRHYFIVDHSTNGTHVNGHAIAKGEPVLLRKGDRIALSGDVVLLFR